MHLGSAPAETVTFLFTDIEGSSRLWEQFPSEMSATLRLHDELLEAMVAAEGGRVFKTVGDAVFAVFLRSEDAIRAAASIQAALNRAEWSPQTPIRVRMAIHMGEAEARGNDFFGPTLNRLARIVDLAHGEQILLSERVAKENPLVARFLEQVELRGSTEPENVYQWVDHQAPRAFPPLRLNRIANQSGNLPSPPSPMVGRVKELSQIRSSLMMCRLITLTGSGGIGKTRLALAFGDRERTSYAAGVWFVELAPVIEARGLWTSLAKALGLENEERAPILERIVERIGASSLLLILDNCEHVIEEVAPVVMALLQRCPNFQILATSREALLIEGERVVRLAPMPLPSESDSLEQLQQNDSIRLFTQAAEFADANIAISERDYSSIAAVCRVLEGNPFAIRLAASRCQTVSLEQLPSKLKRSFRLLEGPNRAKDARHQTLRAVFQWSYGLLEPREQAGFRALSVFKGGWDTSAAVRLLEVEEEEIEEVLLSLLRKSLIETSGDGRWHMLETTRRYAEELLDPSAELVVFRRRHARHFADLLEESLVGFRGDQQGSWRSRIGQERENIGAALLSTDADPDNTEDAFRIASTMWRWWYLDGDYEEGIAQCARLIKQSDMTCPVLVCRLCRGAAWLPNLSGDIHASEHYAISAMAAAEAAESPKEIAITHGLIGSILAWKGDYDEALFHYTQELKEHERLGDRPNKARALQRIGDNLNSAAKPEEAIEWFLQAKSEFLEMGDLVGSAWCHHSIAESYWQLGQYNHALASVEKSIKIREEHGDPRGLIHSWLLAARLMFTSLQIEEARDLLNRSLALNKKIKDRSAVPSILILMATLEESRQPRLAVRLIAQSDQVRDLLSMPIPIPMKRVQTAQMDRLKATLGSEDFEREYASPKDLQELGFGLSLT